MSVSVKRKRGRPRLDEPREIQDFDNNLIQEFKKYPVFYDRQHPQHRNREYTDPIWQRIAQNLNVSITLVKTRMLQLRNRFNLEKRRVEAMMEQQQNSSITSQWSLYERLSFLSSYVKTRRPYSIPVTCNQPMNSSASSTDGGGDEENELNGVEVNKTLDCSFTSNQIADNDNFSNGMQVNGGIDLQETEATDFHPIESNTDFVSKYKSFGEFLASSLIEMNEMQALCLVDKFTIDLVKSLKIEERRKCFVSIPLNTNTDGEDSSTIN